MNDTNPATGSPTEPEAIVDAPTQAEGGSARALGKNVSGAMFWNTAFLPLKTAVSFIASIVLVRAMTEDQFSAYVAVTALLATLGLYTDLGIERSLIRFVPEIEQSYGAAGLWRYLGTLLVVKFALMAPVIILLLAGINYFTDYFKWGANGPTIVVLVVVLLILGALSDVLYQFMLAYFRQAGRNVLDVATTLLQSVLVILLVGLGYGVLGALIALTCATILNVVLGGWMVWRMLTSIQVKGTLRSSWRDIYMRLAKFSAMSFVLNLATYLYDLPFVIFVLTYFGDTAGVALFGLAFGRVVMPILRAVIAPLVGVQMPLLARVRVDHDHAQLNEAYKTVSRFLILVLVPSAVGLALVAQPLVVLFFQSRYADAASIVAVLSLFLFAESFLSPGEVALKVHDRYRTVLLTRLPALLSVPLLFALVPLAGALGAAFAIGIARLLAQLVTSAVAMKSLRLNFPFQFFVRVTVASLAMAITVGVVANFTHAASPLDNLISLVVRLVTGIITFGVCFKLLGGLEAKDKARLLELRVPFKRVMVSWL